LHSPLKEVVRTRCLPGTGSDVVVLTFTTQRWSQFVEQGLTFYERNAELLAGGADAPLLALQVAPPQILHVLRQFVVLSQVPHVTLALENACALLLRLLGELRFGSALECQEPERRKRVELAQARMVARLARPPSLSQIAGDLNVSPRQLQRDFLGFTGLTPIRYLNVVRMSEANSLLAETSLPIAEIAALLGYVSQAHFSAAFRQAYHCSPREVRESFRQADDDLDRPRKERLVAAPHPRPGARLSSSTIRRAAPDLAGQTSSCARGERNTPHVPNTRPEQEPHTERQNVDAV
jgi:AraC-like DNA-binding protein